MIAYGPVRDGALDFGPEAGSTLATRSTFGTHLADYAP
jgi:hypothetical protein